MKENIDLLSVKVAQNKDTRSSFRLDTPQTVSIPDLSGSEDAVDAMGAVVFADEEDSGFFGGLQLSKFLKTASNDAQALHQILPFYAILQVR
jgi:hypothetical protein